VHSKEQLVLSDAQLRAEIGRCLYCAEKPCQGGCPADCSPADFIMAARMGEPADFRRAAALIMAANPLGGVCGLVCPDTHCMARCVRGDFDTPINIPAVQATIVAKARALGVFPEFERPDANGRRVAILGGGPAGCGAAAVLAQAGYAVEIFELGARLGGMATLVPDTRLDRDVLAADLAFVTALGNVTVHPAAGRQDPNALLAAGCDAVVVATGLGEPVRLGVSGEERALSAFDFLAAPERAALAGRRVAVIGGGAVAADCAATAVRVGASQVEMIALERLSEMPLTRAELLGIVQAGVHVTGRTRVTAIEGKGAAVSAVRTRRVALPAGAKFHPSAVEDVAESDGVRRDFDVIILAAGARAGALPGAHPGIVLAGDLESGPSTVVEAVAAGKNAALAVDAYVRGLPPPEIARKNRSAAVLKGLRRLPVPLASEFFGQPLLSPFLLSAGPPSDGYEPMRRAYEAGWAGGVFKTAFDNVPIHIPSRYMFTLGEATFGNCDNVSGHPLDRVCREIEALRREFPDRLTLASTGGPVTGNDAGDRAVWRSNTRMLEAAGACGIEYSLSCPQGGDGTKGDIVAQDAELTAKVVEWVLSGAHAGVPKLFKLTPAVTAIVPIVTAVREVFARHPHAQAGITLANSFPALAFRADGGRWDEGVVVGMSGAGVAPISNLTLAKVAGLGVTVSGNGGAMDYRAAANFLALGARTVQFCSLVMSHGVGIVGELHAGLSHLLAARGLRSVAELIGCALPKPVTPFESLSAVKLISHTNAELCVHCGNCTRCPYLAIALDADKLPHTDAARCVGCSFCTQQCVGGALSMRERTLDEAAALRES
jgi:NADPH-dependent glutamate synthase beta subunit-like oxidoreductase/dihydroorotate dehydrogenase/Pyruvate/2-oxoacid:ferredoxin oxidoreductase delta subunit